MRHTFFCVDAHTCGNPVRVVAGGAPQLPAVSMAEKREIFQRDHDWVRQSLMFEPRGHDVMSGTILYPPSREDCDIGVLFIEVSGCLPMCGHGTIGTVTAVLEEGLVVPKVPGRIAIEAPAGKVEIEYTQTGNLVDQVRLFNVPAYLHARDVTIEVPTLGRLTVDLSYGGNYYVIIEPQENWAGLDTMPVAEIMRLSPLVRAAAQKALRPVHPTDPRIQGVSHVMWCDAPKAPEADARNAVFYGEKAIDRSPCGTGSSARMAQLHARGKLKVGDRFVHESIIGTMFDCRIEGETMIGKQDAILPSVAGWARVIGHNTIFVDDRDPLMHGFQLR
ncbi:hydroxyproline-2-epimerase [Pseudooceanicola lipolyticus]|uniref:Hydroxyproline-2-epimerase n=1 Tax=Pseudooceanicola lipolyticus TaxID=2029104 RepID=A0A2M8J2H5_9RHOB|nr:4-hydroxyproline epimerase [Pseudooceanicola lipolyticus]PJE36974.1 hydroxyproline-2-epimerase [Pseudooceanicola lipolyticus]